MRAYSFRQAIDAGLEPRSYADPVPEGVSLARLEFKMWGKHASLRCFFIDMRTGAKFTLPAFRRYQSEDIGQYSPRDLDIDFSEPGIEGTVYEIVVGRGPRGGLRWEEATPSNDDSRTGTIYGAA